MRYLSINNVEPGMILAYDLFDSQGRILISSKTELTSKYIERIEFLGFDGVYIDDAVASGIEMESVITPKLRAESMIVVREANVDRCKNVAKKIVDEIMGKGNISFDMTDLRTYDSYTFCHSVNVAVISCVTGLGIGLEEQELGYLVMAGLLHDLGKLSIPLEILNKPDRLTAEEYEIMKSHAKRSYELIKDRIDLSAQIKQAVLYHHENVDGSGYPDGAEGSQLSIYTKILHVADVYDALVTKRPYKEAYSPYEASEYLMGGCGIMFEHEVVQTFLRYVPLFPKGTQVKLSDGRQAVIFDNTGQHNLRPLIRLMDGTMLDLASEDNLNITIIRGQGLYAPVMETTERAREKMKTHVRYRILAVDDMKTSLQYIKDILEGLYDVTILKSGYQALTYLKKYDFPDIILLDIDMPKMDGIETAIKIQEITQKSVPILFVTALHDASTVLRCREAGAAGYIMKPFKEVYLKSEIKRVITGRSDTD